MSTADPKVGLVLAGGGARGAYEAGALSVLLPALEARGERPGVLLGTSVGAVNTAWLAATAHLDAAGSTESMLDRWRTLGWDAVLGPLVSPFELSRALVYLGELLGVPGAALTSLLDTGPQAATLREQIDFDQLRRNIESGDLQTAAVVATSYATGDSVVFYDRHGGAAAITDDRRRGIRYANSSLAPDHVQASAAIEALFPAIDITAPAKFAGWYGDGGAQLNTPIKPALTLGSGRVVVVGLNSLQPPPTPVLRRPEVFDGLALILQSMLADGSLTTSRPWPRSTSVSAGRPRPARRPGAHRRRPPVRALPGPIALSPTSSSRPPTGIPWVESRSRCGSATPRVCAVACASETWLYSGS